jgi:hypothetical protein
MVRPLLLWPSPQVRQGIASPAGRGLVAVQERIRACMMNAASKASMTLAELSVAWWRGHGVTSALRRGRMRPCAA